MGLAPGSGTSPSTPPRGKIMDHSETKPDTSDANLLPLRKPLAPITRKTRCPLAWGTDGRGGGAGGICPSQLSALPRGLGGPGGVQRSTSLQTFQPEPRTDFCVSHLVRCLLITGISWTDWPGVGHVVTLEDARCPHWRKGYGFWRGRNHLLHPPPPIQPYSVWVCKGRGGGAQATDTVCEKVIKMALEKSR